MEQRNGGKQKKLAGYQNFFEGYTDVRYPKKNGKGFTIRRVYTAPWQLHDLADRDWVKQKLLFAVLMAAMAGIYVWAAFQKIPANSSGMVAVPMGAAAASMVFLLMNLISYIIKPRRMTLYDMKNGHKTLMRWGALTAGCSGLAGLMTVAYELGNSFPQPLLSFGCAAAHLCCAALAWLIYYRELHTDYFEEENETEIPFFPDEEF